ncbi:Flagellar hook-associated protein 2 [Rosistilla carotiformis]|uniref:Filament cap protein n=1 Tax=Rosistilla carotiformis TaxID=2528017 RepID=A0A518JVJ4_9BACT|nr:flagellar filament capping protein FliD [Rosistilla carotiformis]QDV69555.1 Flagellar hook-associated protein 2 [Rosistilla carotiformis]
MGTIQSSVGLITGIPIQETVEQLMAISARPRDLLSARTAALQQEQVAITELTALAVGLELASASFGSESLYETTAVSSSNSDALSVIQTADSVNLQNQQVRVVQLAQTNSFGSRNLGSSTESLGYSGQLTIETGGFIDNSVALEDLNGGRGVERGQIRITDRSGNSATIDLRGAATIDDVLATINESSDIDVRASTSGDKIVLTDKTGKTLSNLSVSEVGGGSTASDLGLRGINTASDSATGRDIFSLSAATSLSTLRDGLGLGFGSDDDIAITLRDGTELSIDFDDFSREASIASGTTSATDPNAQLTIKTVAKGGDYDGLEVLFVNDDGVAAGSETVQLLEGSYGKQLVFHIDEGNTTSANIADALAGNEELAALFTATAGGDGTGTVSAADFAVVNGGAAIDPQTDPTIEDLLRVLNDADPKLKATLNASGDAIQLTDLSEGTGTLTIADAEGSTLATDLGLVFEGEADSTTGITLQSGLQSVSLSTLAGGAGLGTLGTLSITVHDGSTADVDLSGATSVADVISAINNSGLDVEADYNDQGTGIAIRDLTGGTVSNLKVSSLDDTASKLGLEIDTTETFANGNNLRAQYVSRNTALSALNQGQGVGTGSFTIQDSNGDASIVSLGALEPQTVGALIDQINGLSIGVEASLNADGNGIRIIDTSNGEGTLKIIDRNGRTSAASLGIAGTAETRVIDGEVRSVIDGSQGITVNVNASDTVATIAAKIQELGQYASASAGSGRLEILSKRGGSDGRLAVSTTGFDIGLRQTASAQDAIIEVGESESASLFYSSDNVFSDAISGLSLTAKKVTDSPVEVNVTKNNSAVVSSVTNFVSAYNRLVTRMDALTAFDETSQTVGLLFGSGEVLRIQSQLGSLFTGRINGAGDIKSLGEIGIRLSDTGQMTFDSAKLTAKLETEPDSVKDFFTTDSTGFSSRVQDAIDKIAGVESSVLLNKNDALQRRIETNNDRIASYNLRLESEEARLYKQYYAMEEAISKLQSNQSYISNIAPITMPS